MALEDVPRATRNPREHDLSLIRRSIETFGFTAPGVLDERTGRLVAGHGRLTALEKMHWEGVDPPEGVQLANGGAWLVPIIRGWSSRSDAEAEAYVIADNRLNERGGWDDHVLAEVLSDVAETSPDLLESVGYTGAELDDLIATVSVPMDPEELSEKYGEPDDSAFWPEIKIKVTPDLFDRWRAVLDRYEGRDDTSKLQRFVEAVELGRA